MAYFLFTVYAQTLNDPSAYADATSALRNVWLFVGVGFTIFFVLCYMRVRSLVMAMRYSAWLFVATAAIFGAVSYNRGSSVSIQSQADANIRPKNVSITYSPPQTIITWQTDKSTVEYIIYQNENNSDIIAFDQQQLVPTQNHKVIITDLQSQAVYPFRIKYAEQEFKTADGKDLIIKVP